MAEDLINSGIGSSIFDELVGASGAFLEAENRITRAASSFDAAIASMNKSMSFLSRDLQNTFKQYNSIEGKKQAFFKELFEERKRSSQMVKDLEDAVKKSKEAYKASGDAADLQKANAAQEKLNIAKKYDIEIQSINDTKAFWKEQSKQYSDYRKKLLTSTIDNIVGIFQKSLSNAWSTLNQAYESNYKTMTSYNAYSKSEYNAVLNELQRFIKQNNLSSVVNIADYQNEISKILSSGLTKDLATTVAKYSVLSKEGGISADFSDQSFLKMIKKMENSGQDVEGFLEDIMTQSKAVIDEVGDSFGFANGQINVMMNSLYELSDITNMTDAAIKNSATSMTALNGVLGSTKFDTSKLYSEILDFAKTGILDKSASSLLRLSGMTATEMRSILSTQGAGAVLQKQMQSIYSQYGGMKTGELQGALQQSLGDTASVDEILSIFNKYGTYSEFSAAYSGALNAAQSSSASSYMSNLKNYQTNQEKLQNESTNALTDLNQFAHENLATEETLNHILSFLTGTSVSNLAGSVLNFGRMLRATGKGGGISLSPLSGGTGYLQELDYQTKALHGKITNFGETMTMGRNSLSGLGKALGVAGIIAGLGVQATSAFEAAKIAKENGLSSGGAFMGGLLTGYTGFGMTNEQKMQAVKEGGLIDWGQAFKTAGAGALIGGGVGTLAGGPLGTVIGGAAGAVAGFAGNAITQAIDKVDYKQYLNSSFGKLGESISETFSNISENSQLIQEYSNSISKIDDITDKLNKAKDGELKLSARQTKQLEIQLEQEKELQRIREKEIHERAKGQDLDVETTTSTAKLAEKQRSLIALLQGAAGKLNLSESSNLSNLSETDLRSALGSDYTEYARLLEDLQAGGIIGSSGKGLRYDTLALLQFMGKGKGIKTSKVETDFASSASLKGGVLSDTYKTLSQNVEDFYNQRESLFTAASAILGPDSSNYAIQNKLQSLADYYHTLDGDWGVVAERFKNDTALFDGLSSSQISGYKNWLKENSVARDSRLRHYYRSGLAYVPYDNFPAVLHKGEQVLTAMDAANLRHSGMSSRLSDALVSQTDTIIAILNNIYDYLISGRASSSQNNIFNQAINYGIPAGV